MVYITIDRLKGGLWAFENISNVFNVDRKIPGLRLVFPIFLSCDPYVYLTFEAVRNPKNVAISDSEIGAAARQDFEQVIRVHIV